MERPVISQVELVFVRSGQRARGSITIRQPYVLDSAEARCEIQVTAPKVFRLRQSISGGDTLQALLLAIRYLATMLVHYKGKGLQLLEVDGEEWALEPYFGRLAFDNIPPPTTTIWIRARRRRKRAKRRPRPAAAPR